MYCGRNILSWWLHDVYYTWYYIYLQYVLLILFVFNSCFIKVMQGYMILGVCANARRRILIVNAYYYLKISTKSLVSACTTFEMHTTWDIVHRAKGSGGNWFAVGDVFSKVSPLLAVRHGAYYMTFDFLQKTPKTHVRIHMESAKKKVDVSSPVLVDMFLLSDSSTTDRCSISLAYSWASFRGIVEGALAVDTICYKHRLYHFDFTALQLFSRWTVGWKHQQLPQVMSRSGVRVHFPPGRPSWCDGTDGTGKFMEVPFVTGKKNRVWITNGNQLQIATGLWPCLSKPVFDTCIVFSCNKRRMMRDWCVNLCLYIYIYVIVCAGLAPPDDTPSHGSALHAQGNWHLAD